MPLNGFLQQSPFFSFILYPKIQSFLNISRHVSVFRHFWSIRWFCNVIEETLVRPINNFFYIVIELIFYCTAVRWLEYCRYGVKPKTTNLSIKLNCLLHVKGYIIWYEVRFDRFVCLGVFIPYAYMDISPLTV